MHLILGYSLTKQGSLMFSIYIEALITLVHYKVYLQLLPDLLTVGIPGIVFHHTYVNIHASSDEIVIQYVFHDVSLLQLPEPKPRISKPRIGIIVFDGSPDILSSLYIITNGFLYGVSFCRPASTCTPYEAILFPSSCFFSFLSLPSVILSE